MSSSAEEILVHKALVSKYLHLVVKELLDRADEHDNSKLEEPEASVFDEYTPRLAECTYGSKEYNKFLEAMEPALKHHYANNRHHPEHYPDGIKDMTLVDCIEMICDWFAATRKHNDGNILMSIEKNRERFGYTRELESIFVNTVKALENPISP